MSSNSKFKGYDLEQLRVQRAILTVKIAVEKRRLADYFSAKHVVRSSAFDVALQSAEVAGIGIKVFNTAKRFMRRVKPRKK